MLTGAFGGGKGKTDRGRNRIRRALMFPACHAIKSTISDACILPFGFPMRPRFSLFKKAAILGLSFTKLLPNAQTYSNIYFTTITEKFLISCALISINQFIRQ